MIVTVVFIFVGLANYQCFAGNCYSKRNEDQPCVKENHIGIKPNERRILLIGKTGVGKSTSGNAILGENVFMADISGKAVTLKTELRKAERFDKNLVVVDTPGIFYTKETNNKIMIEISKCYGLTSPGLHAIILVLSVGRITSEDNETVKFFVEHFGQDLINYLLIIFTGKDNLERDNKTIKTFIDSIEEDTDLKQLLGKIDQRYVAFGYQGRKQDRDEEVKKLLDMIDEMVEKNGGSFYTNEIYEEAEKFINERWEEEKRRKREKHDAELAAAIKHAREQYQSKENQLLDEIYRLKHEHKERNKEEFEISESKFRDKFHDESEKGWSFWEMIITILKKMFRF